MAENPLSQRSIAAAHLLRRAGFGGTAEEIAELSSLSHAEAVEKLLNFSYDGNLAFSLERKLSENNYDADLNDIAYWWLVTMTRSRQPLQEKMALFWHGHFTTSYSKVREPILLLQQNQLFRDNALGNFKELVKKISRDPAMIDYLDGQANRKGKPNENYARELLELFTIGIGNYTEQDIREAARAFTGWGFRDRAFVFTANQHDTGTKTFMGKSGNFDGDDIINIITDRPETANHIAGKLWEFFVYPSPEPEVVQRMGDIFYKSGYNIKELLRAIFNAPEFLSAKAYRALVKSPVEYVVGTLRQLGLASLDPVVARAAAGMGQVIFNPPTVKGWDGGLSWINSAYYFERINTMNGLVTNRSQQGPHLNLYEVLGLTTATQAASQPRSAQAVVDKMLGLTLDGQAQPEVKTALVEYLEAGTTLKPEDFAKAAAGLPAARNLDSRIRGTLHLIMATPDYMLK